MASCSTCAIVKAMLLLVLMVVVPHAEAAISCGTVVSNLRPCLPYVMGSGNTVPAACCKGVKSLYTAATTTSDRQAICSCLKSLASSYSGVDYNRAAAIPGKCGVNVPYKISPSIDCSKVQ